jgi:hypothetical protein
LPLKFKVPVVKLEMLILSFQIITEWDIVKVVMQEKIVIAKQQKLAVDTITVFRIFDLKV